jgi:hypothetical protein
MANDSDDGTTGWPGFGDVDWVSGPHGVAPRDIAGTTAQEATA